MLERVKYLLLALCVSFFPTVATAENIMDIFQLALKNDPELRAAQAAKKAEEEARPQAAARLYPTIVLNAGVGKASQQYRTVDWINDFQRQTAEALIGSGTQIFTNMNFSLSLRQPLFNVPNFRNLQVSDTKLVQAELNYRIAQQELLFRVAERYFNVLSAIDTLNFARAEKNAIANQLNQTKQRFQVGLTAVTDVHEAQARHDLAVAQEIQAESELANQKEALRRVSGEIHDNLFMLKSDTPLIPPTPTNMNDWTEAAKGQNLEIASKRMEADILRAEMNMVRGEYMPTIDFNASYGYNQNGSLFAQSTLDGQVSINMNMVIFEGNILSSRIREKTHRLEKLSEELESVQREILQQTRNAYLGVLAGMSYVKALSQALKSSDQALNATNAGFEVGTRSAVEVLDAQRDLFRSQRDLARARYDYILNMLRLKIAVGLLSIDDLEQINNWLG